MSSSKDYNGEDISKAICYVVSVEAPPPFLASHKIQSKGKKERKKERRIHLLFKRMAQFAAQGGRVVKLLFNIEGGEVQQYRVVGEKALVGGSRSFRVKLLLGSRWRNKSNWLVHSRGYHGGGGGQRRSIGGDDDDDDDDESEEYDDELASFRGLVLDLSYRPITVVCWKRAICLEFMDKADVLEYYDQTVSSPSGSYNIPAVLRVPHLLQVVKRIRSKLNLSRKNILYRDGYTCQYCSSQENLTIDHVFPMSRGGEWVWENLVTACSKCNSTKGKKTLEEANMTLLKQPKAPKDYDILAIPLTGAAVRMLSRRKGTPEEWRQYLS